MPKGAPIFRSAARWRGDFPRAEDVLKERGLTTAVGDEGGFAPKLKSAEDALESIVDSRREGRLQARQADLPRARCRGLGVLRQRKEALRLQEIRRVEAHRRRTGRVLCRALRASIPIISIEDGCAENDWDGWKILTDATRRQDSARRRRSLCHECRIPPERHRPRQWPIRFW